MMMKPATCIAVMVLTGVATAEESTLRDASHEARRHHQETKPSTLGDRDDHDGNWLSASCDLGSSTAELSQSITEVSAAGSADDELVPVRAERAVLIRSPPPSSEPIQRVSHREMKPAAFPYVNHADGWMTEDDHTGIGAVSLEVAPIESDLLRTTLASRFYLPGSWEVDLLGSWYREQVEPEAVDLLIGVVNVNWRPFVSPAYAWRIGGGGRISHDEQGNLGGWNITSSIEVYPMSPLSISVAGEVGSLGAATVTGLRAAVGGHINRWAIEIGWQRTSIGDVVLAGPFAGLRCSF